MKHSSRAESSAMQRLRGYTLQANKLESRSHISVSYDYYCHLDNFKGEGGLYLLIKPISICANGNCGSVDPVVASVKYKDPVAVSSTSKSAYQNS